MATSFSGGRSRDVLNRINVFDPAGEINIAPLFKSAEFVLDLSLVFK
jgi:hypothetical protein